MNDRNNARGMLTMRIIEELQQLPSSAAMKILGLLDFSEQKRIQIEGELVGLWMEEEEEETTRELGTIDGFCWFEHLRGLPASLIEIQLKMVFSANTLLTSNELLVIRFTILFCAGKIVPNRNTITESQLRVLLAILRSF